MTSNLLATKLNRPSLPPRRVFRPNLMQRLDEGLAQGQQVILVSAPAGFGKTICIGQWIETLELPIAWLSLDPSDDDPGRFFSYLIAALSRVNENIGQELKAILRSGQVPPSEILSTTLVNDILDLEDGFLLVLDDFHVIQDDFILQILETLINHLPPPLHLALITREDPSLSLARLRANNQMTEIRAAELRFSSSDIHQFLNEVMNLSLSMSDVSTLEQRTEGWIVGLQLAGLSIRDRPDPSSFIDSLSGSHRFILSYLTEEVLSRQAEEIQSFLLQTSILERLNGDLCEAVTGRTDSRELLEQLFNANLFLISLDEKNQWFRYHQLFADLLRDQQSVLQPTETAELHRRASRWYRRSGMVSEAVQHALAAAEYAWAIELIEKHALDMIMQWHLKTVENWMRSIPAEWIARSPRANLVFAWIHLAHGNYAQAVPFLGRLDQIFSSEEEGTKQAEGDPAVEARWLALQAMLLNGQKEPRQSLELAKRALEIAPEHNGQVLSMIYLELAGAYQQLDDYDSAKQAFQKIIQLGQAAGNSVAELMGIAGLGLMAIQYGKYYFAFELASRGIERIEAAGSLPPISTAVFGELGVIHYQWHQLDKAHTQFIRAIQVGKLSGFSDAELYYGVILSRLFEIRGNLDGAVREIEKVVRVMQVDAPMAVREEILDQQVRVALAQDRLAAAEATLENLGFSFRPVFRYPELELEKIDRPKGLLYMSALRIVIYRARVKGEMSSLKQGIDLANNLIQGATQRGYFPVALEALLLRAQVNDLIGNEQARLADVIAALELGEPEGIISAFVEEGLAIADALTELLEQGQVESVRWEYVRRILSAFPVHQLPKAEDGGGIKSGRPITAPTYGEDEALTVYDPLTEREIEVLQLMAEGLKYGEIADSLFISLNTVRSHVKSIYGKLDVNNRTKAIERAQRLEIL